MVCPGHAVNFHQLSSSRNNNHIIDPVLWHYFKVYLGHTNDTDIRYNSASGGLLTSLLIFALKERIIDGALVTKMSKDKPLEPQPYIARTKEEIIAAARSKYCPVPANIALSEILKTPGSYAIVGLPCHIQGIRKAEAVLPQLKSRIAFHLGVMCSHTDNFLMTEFILKWKKLNKQNVRSIAYRGNGWPGNMSIKLKDNTQYLLPFFRYNILHELDYFTPSRCLMCVDLMNRQTDILFGDAWMPGIYDKIGTSIALTRTAEGEKLLQYAIQKKVLSLSELSNKKIYQWRPSLFKMKRAMGFISWHRILRKKAPLYDIQLPKPGILGYISSAAAYFAGNLGKQRWFWGVMMTSLPAVQFLFKLAKSGLTKLLSSKAANS